MKLEVGICYKHIPTGQVYKLAMLGKRYAHSQEGTLSSNVMSALFDPVLEHIPQRREQVRYMEESDWQRLGIFRQQKSEGRFIDVFDDGGKITPLSEVIQSTPTATKSLLELLRGDSSKLQEGEKEKERDYDLER